MISDTIQFWQLTLPLEPSLYFALYYSIFLSIFYGITLAKLLILRWPNLLFILSLNKCVIGIFSLNKEYNQPLMIPSFLKFMIYLDRKTLQRKSSKQFTDVVILDKDFKITIKIYFKKYNNTHTHTYMMIEEIGNSKGIWKVKNKEPNKNSRNEK